jgi:hypothetical protein
MSGDEVAVALISMATLIAGVVVIMAGLRYRAQIRELRHRERMAMIDKGLLPPPEFQAADGSVEPHQRSRSFGIILVGLGFALMFLIGVAGGALDVGIGIGGAVAILGAAFIVRSVYSPSRASSMPHLERPSAPSPIDYQRP